VWKRNSVSSYDETFSSIERLTGSNGKDYSGVGDYCVPRLLMYMYGVVKGCYLLNDLALRLKSPLTNSTGESRRILGAGTDESKNPGVLALGVPEILQLTRFEDAVSRENYEFAR